MSLCQWRRNENISGWINSAREITKTKTSRYLLLVLPCLPLKSCGFSVDIIQRPEVTGQGWIHEYFDPVGGLY